MIRLKVKVDLSLAVNTNCWTNVVLMLATLAQNQSNVWFSSNWHRSPDYGIAGERIIKNNAYHYI